MLTVDSILTENKELLTAMRTYATTKQVPELLQFKPVHITELPEEAAFGACFLLLFVVCACCSEVQCSCAVCLWTSTQTKRKALPVR